MEPKTILIGIQARSNSTRLPQKVMKKIDDKPIIDHVVRACRKAAKYINEFSDRHNMTVDIAVLIPEGDELSEYLMGRVPVVKGPEDDLINRYKNAIERYDPDFIVRVTADCPMIPPFLISKAINVAVRGKYDFVTSAHPSFRTFFDGADIEVCSKRLFDWVDENAEGDEREHVFSRLSRDAPKEFSFAHIFNYIDLSSLKLSVDTEKDYELSKKQIESVIKKKQAWESVHGRGSAHSF